MIDTIVYGCFIPVLCADSGGDAQTMYANAAAGLYTSPAAVTGRPIQPPTLAIPPASALPPALPSQSALSSLQMATTPTALPSYSVAKPAMQPLSVSNPYSMATMNTRKHLHACPALFNP